jgi:hypothetical protein
VAIVGGLRLACPCRSINGHSQHNFVVLHPAGGKLQLPYTSRDTGDHYQWAYVSALEKLGNIAQSL